MLQNELNAALRQRDALEHFLAVRKFGGVRFEEFSSGRDVEIQLVDIQDSSPCQRGGRWLRNCIAFGVDLPGMFLLRVLAGQCQLGYGGDTGQSFAAKSEAGDAV